MKRLDIIEENIKEAFRRINELDKRYWDRASSSYVNSLYADFLKLKKEFEQFSCNHNYVFKEPRICPKCGKVLD